MNARKIYDAFRALNDGMGLAMAGEPVGEPVYMAVLRARVEGMLSNPIIDLADMYKTSHKDMYPEKMTVLQSYGEAREGSSIPHIVSFGMQVLVNELCGLRVTETHIQEAAVFFEATFGDKGVFERIRPGWQAIVDAGGYLPVRICALPEGTVVPPGTPLFTVESTNDKAPWVANWLETKLSHIWYTTAVASVAFALRQSLEARCIDEGMTPAEAAEHAKKAGICDFGLRGVECLDAGRRGGMAALTSSMSSDNTAGMAAIQAHYPDSPSSHSFKGIGASIPAAEHSTITAHGKANELEAYKHILERFPTGPVSIVADSYDYHQAITTIFCGELKQAIDDRYAKAVKAVPDGFHAVVIRPDSGDMLKDVPFTLSELFRAFGGHVTAKGFKVLHPSVRVIQGDGIDLESYPKLLAAVQEAGFSVTNIVAGSGGGLLQKVNRDTIRFAIKANSAVIDGEPREIQKETVGKKSKRGRLSVQEVADGEYKTFQSGTGDEGTNLIRMVYENGDAYHTERLADVRERIDAAHARLHKKAKC